MDRWMTLTEATKYAGVHRNTLTGAAKRGKLKVGSINGGRSKRIHTSAIDAWLNRAPKRPTA